jgi:hypothetical protein
MRKLVAGSKVRPQKKKKIKKNLPTTVDSFGINRHMYPWITLLDHTTYLFFHSFLSDESNTVGILMESLVQPPPTVCPRHKPIPELPPMIR